MFTFQMFVNFAIFLSLSRCALASTTSTLPTVSITNDLDYIALRTCAAYCIYGNSFNSAYLPQFLGCAHEDVSIYIDYYNTCFCNAGYIPQATSFLGSCISSACSDGIDIPAAITVWENYCTAAGYPMNNVAQPTTSLSVVSSTVTATNGQASTVLVTIPLKTGSSNSQTTSANTDTTSSRNSNLGPIIGGAISGTLVLGIAAIIITWMILREKQKRRAIDMMVPPISFSASGRTSGRARPQPEDGLISSVTPSIIPFATPAPAPAPVLPRVPVPKPADPRIGLIPLSPTSSPVRQNLTPRPPGYSEHDGREIPEFLEAMPEMQGVGRNGLEQWEMQG